MRMGHIIRRIEQGVMEVVPFFLKLRKSMDVYPFTDTWDQ